MTVLVPCAPAGINGLTRYLEPADRAFLAQIDPTRLAGLGAPAADLATDRCRAAEVAVQVLGSHRHRIRTSPLGPGWSRDLDIEGPIPPASLLRDAGWLCMDPLMARLGSPSNGHWLIMEGGHPLGMADFVGPCSEAGPDELLGRVLRRARRRGTVDLRILLELRVQQRRGQPLPDHEVLHAAAALEAGLRGSELAAWRRDSAYHPVDSPVTIRQGASRRGVGTIRRWSRPRPIVALSGVDGAGKSSLTEVLLHDLQRMGLSADVVWTRPGMRMHWVDRVRRVVRRSRPDRPTVARIAQGERAQTATRSGLVGWVWTMLVTLTFLADVWWRQLRTPGIKIYDRHLTDALTTLGFVYAGVDLRVPNWLVRAGLPRAWRSFYLRIDANTAAARKPGDTFGLYAVQRQLEHYDAMLGGRPEVRVLDASRSPRQLATTILSAMSEP